jgi:hypothetical protein
VDESANLALPLIMPSQSLKHVTHNEALLRLDAVVQLAVLDRDLAAPPGSPAEGDRYIVAAGATGDWDDWDLDVALYADGAWMRLEPTAGWIAFVADEAAIVYWTGSAWQNFASTLNASAVPSSAAGGIAATTVQAALEELDSEKAPKASPTFTGTPAAPTASGGTSTTQLATTAFVQSAISALINAAPGALDTLDELAAALGDDAGFAASMTTALAGKASRSSGSWTPGVTFNNASSGMSLTASGIWRRHDDVIFAFGSFSFSAKGSSTGNARLTGLPTAAAANYFGSAVLNFYSGFASLGGTPMLEVNSGATTAGFYGPGAAAAAALTDANFTNTSSAYFVVVYVAA